jgi:hypothetical protein|tara:strand:+ start:1799 stop:2518 length:720 start_codon:yes stop_codon:yes gene_type:complete
MGLRANDLHDLVKPVFEVDSYQSKMGSDEEIVVVSFSVMDEQASKDLVDFIEKGYGFVLDADHSPGEIENGAYKVFVEMERNKSVSRNIVELIDGVGKLAEIDSFRFRYHKSFTSYDASNINLSEMIPADATSYDNTVVQESSMNHFKDFFSKSFMENIEIFGDDLILKKPFGDAIGLTIKDFNTSAHINENLQDKINMNDYAEIIFLTKYLGDYNVTKFGAKTLTLENKGHTLVVERL